MNKRDKRIIENLERFRVMSRNDIVDIHFSHLNNSVNSANTVLKRLVRDGQIESSSHFRPFVYFPAGSNMKRDSAKIPHFLKIVECYKELQKYYQIDKFLVEPKFNKIGKDLVEPDALTVIRGNQFFIEIQRNTYNQKVMDAKIKRYEDLFYSADFDVFPFILMITNTIYSIDSDILKVYQVQSIDEFMNKLGKREKKTENYEKGIKIKLS